MYFNLFLILVVIVLLLINFSFHLGLEGFENTITKLIVEVENLKAVLQKDLLVTDKSDLNLNTIFTAFVVFVLIACSITLIYFLTGIGYNNSMVLSNVMHDCTNTILTNMTDSARTVLTSLGSSIDDSSAATQQFVLELNTNQTNDILAHIKNYMAQKEMNAITPFESACKSVLDTVIKAKPGPSDE